MGLDKLLDSVLGEGADKVASNITVLQRKHGGNAGNLFSLSFEQRGILVINFPSFSHSVRTKRSFGNAEGVTRSSTVIYAVFGSGLGAVIDINADKSSSAGRLDSIADNGVQHVARSAPPIVHRKHICHQAD